MQTTNALGRALRPLKQFLRLEAAGGLVLMGASVLALIVANSPLATYYSALLDVRLEIRLGSAGLSKPLLLWINDGLMAVFFFLVGLELKGEVLEGHLATLRRASLPAFAAVGGMLAPAALYAFFNSGNPVAMKGWAIPAATDIAFALGVLSLLGKRVPVVLKVFLLGVAVFDDLGAIVVIALFYTSQLSGEALAVSVVMIGGLAVLNRAGVTRPAGYILLGIPLWIAVLQSGVHATLAGVILALFIPLRTTGQPKAHGPPLRRLVHVLHPWVAFGVLPVFAMANAGVPLGQLSLADLTHPVPMGIMTGLLLGKQLGIMLLAGLAVRLGLASLPEGIRWAHIYGAALLCGVGFTMSLFIASLAFEQGGAGYSGLDRLGILAGSLLAGVAGFLVLRAVLRKRPGASP